MNETKEQKITLLQALLIYLIAVYSASIRLIPSMTSSVAHQAAWLDPICSLVISLPLLYVLFKVVRKFEGQSLHDIFRKVFGKAAGLIISVLFLIWLIIELGLYLKYAGENLVTTEYIGTDINLLIFLIVLLVGIMLRWGISVLARMNKIIFILTLLQFLIILFFLFLHFRPDFITPISTLDIGPVLLSTVYPLAIFVLITPVFIFNDQIQYDKKSFSKLTLTTAGFLSVVDTLLMLALIGMLSYPIVAQLKLPFFSAVENISVFKSSAGLDSLFMAIWMLAEFVTIAFFTYCISRLIKNIFKLKSQTPLLTAILGFGLFFAIFFSSDMFQLILFSNNISPILNLTFGLMLPFILFLTAKIRKMI